MKYNFTQFLGMLVGEGAPVKTTTRIEILKNQKLFGGNSKCYADEEPLFL